MKGAIRVRHDPMHPLRSHRLGSRATPISHCWVGHEPHAAALLGPASINTGFDTWWFGSSGTRSYKQGCAVPLHWFRFRRPGAKVQASNRQKSTATQATSQTGQSRRSISTGFSARHRAFRVLLGPLHQSSRSLHCSGGSSASCWHGIDTAPPACVRFDKKEQQTVDWSVPFKEKSSCFSILQLFDRTGCRARISVNITTSTARPARHHPRYAICADFTWLRAGSSGSLITIFSFPGIECNTT